MLQNTSQLQRTQGQDGLVATDGTKSVHILNSSLTVQYAFYSQRGFYPDAPDKANQDAACAIEKLGGYSENHFFGVYDGHGELGSECSSFAKDKIPSILAKDRNLRMLPDHALHNAMLTANWQLHQSSIDDTLSGSTACAALVQGGTLYIANVGDSRAVLAERAPGTHILVARDLSWDQTPFRQDEYRRVVQAGARVLTLDQLEGLKDPSVPCWTSEEDCDGDPPRLWAAGGMYPGTAFTRSIGDAVAEDIGVIPDPEITIVNLTPNQPFAILATDGVWEFISSQKAVDIVSRCSSPQEAAKTLVATAYKTWLQRETRTDDITALVLFFQPCSPSKQLGRVSLVASSTAPQR